MTLLCPLPGDVTGDLVEVTALNQSISREQRVGFCPNSPHFHSLIKCDPSWAPCGFWSLRTRCRTRDFSRFVSKSSNRAKCCFSKGNKVQRPGRGSCGCPRKLQFDGKTSILQTALYTHYRTLFNLSLMQVLWCPRELRGLASPALWAFLLHWENAKTLLGSPRWG